MVDVILVAGSLVVCVWLTLCWRMLRGSSVPAPAPTRGIASVTVVVAARNEAPRIGALVESLLRQDHPDFEVVIVDDRSRDCTGDTARRAAGNDSRIRTTRVDATPPGWQGRLHAQGEGAALGRMRWLLFLSADQRLATPSFLRSVVAEAERRPEAALSIVGPFRGHRWWQRLWFHPIVNNPLVWGTLLWLQRWPRSVWLTGAPMMRRETYLELGGVRAATTCGAGAFDDFGWARALRANGWRGRMVYHPDLLDVSNWEGFGEFWAGATRWFAGIFTHRRGGWIVASAAGMAVGTIALAAIAVLFEACQGRVPGTGVLAASAAGAAIGIGYCRWDRRSLLFFPWIYVVAIGVLVLLTGAAYARFRNRVFWRGDWVRVVSDPPP
jgi:hypothetical protein